MSYNPCDVDYHTVTSLHQGEFHAISTTALLIGLPLLFLLAKLWRIAPTPPMGVSVGPIGLIHSDRADDLGRWGIRRSPETPGAFLIGGPRTRVAYLPIAVRPPLGAGRVVIKVGRLKANIGARHASA